MSCFRVASTALRITTLSRSSNAIHLNRNVNFLKNKLTNLSSTQQRFSSSHNSHDAEFSQSALKHTLLGASFLGLVIGISFSDFNEKKKPKSVVAPVVRVTKTPEPEEVEPVVEESNLEQQTTVEVVEETKAVEELAPPSEVKVEEVKPVEVIEEVQPAQIVEETKPTEVVEEQKASETVQEPAQSSEVVEEVKSAEVVEETKAVEAAEHLKPAEEQNQSEPAQSSEIAEVVQIEVKVADETTDSSSIVIVSETNSAEVSIEVIIPKETSDNNVEKVDAKIETQTPQTEVTKD